MKMKMKTKTQRKHFDKQNNKLETKAIFYSLQLE